MKGCSAALAAHLAQEVTTLAMLWKLTRRDGVVLGFTNHDQDIMFGGVTYYASTGFTPSASAGAGDMSVDNQEVAAFLDSATLKDSDIRAGLYHFADIEIRLVNWADLTQNELKMRKGTLGIVRMVNGELTAEIRGLTQWLTTIVGETFGPTCRAEFGDSRCKVNLAPLTQNRTVQSATPKTVVPTVALPAGKWADGVITFNSGQNNGFGYEVKSYDGTTLTLFLPAMFPIAPGDTFSIVPGCDKLASTCSGTYNNIANMRAEPFIPGTDSILQYPNAIG